MNTAIILASEGVNPVKSVGNILFYIFLALLVIVLVAICLIFTRSKTFKVRMREQLKEKSDVYEAPKLVKVYDKQVKEDLKYTIEKELKDQAEAAEKAKLNKETTKESHIINYSAELKEKEESQNK